MIGEGMRIREDLRPLRRRTLSLFGILLALLAVIAIRLVDLQVVHADEWRQLARNNRLRRLPESALRGRLYDRYGTLLADNVVSYQLLLFPEESHDLAQTQLFLAQIDVADLQTLRERLSQRPVMSAAPVVIAEDLTWQQVSRIRAHQSDYPELAVVHGFRRFYPFGALTAHAVGYLRPVTLEEVRADPSLSAHALVGATGVEAMMDERLAGEDGERYAVVDARGRQLGVLEKEEPVPGEDLTLTLDLGLQQVAARALGDEAGAVIALDPRSGAVRVLYSAPSFDPNLFVGRLSRADWERLRDDPWHPLQNRALQGEYPPGSTIKPFFATAGYEEGVVTPRSSVYCSGSVVIYGHIFRCWRRQGHGRVAFERSLEVSCDVYYYLLGQQLGIDRIDEWLRLFGFGAVSGLGLPGEKDGLIGGEAWSERVRGHAWYPGETISVAIGQGALEVTPIQLARAFAAIASGDLRTPYLVEDGSERPRRQLDVSPAALGHVRDGVWKVVHGVEGTARKLADLPVAGKTGTAQVVALQEDIESLDKRLQHHAWFEAYGPRDAPELVVVVLVEHGGGGSAVAAPVAGEVMRAALGEIEGRSRASDGG